MLELNPNHENGVRLIETLDRKKGRYACLSYCWGISKTQAGQTKRSNLSRHLKGISLSYLPSTVVDAIHLCHKLGIQYLWVDRLCIVQDDKEDWAREASKMCDIYSRSTLTISVPICRKSSQSPLEERHKWWLRKQSHFGIIEFTDEKSNSKSSLWLHRRFRRRDPWVFEEEWRLFCEVSKDKNHWLGRGWTFQEWVLSPRVLHIDSMTIWDCFNGYANELNQRGMTVAHVIRNPKEFGKGILWRSIIEEYSRRHIAYERDRLPALAGLAEHYRRETGYTYLAGMWLEEMPSFLLWQASLGTPARGRELANQMTPSWSWAHHNGPVSFLYAEAETDTEFSFEVSIKDHHCRYEPPSSISTVVEAWIDIHGSLSIVTGVVTGRGIDELLVGTQSWEFHPDNEDWDLDDAIEQGSIQLLLFGSVQVLVLSDGDVEYVALVLQRCRRLNDDSPWCFRRIGLASLITLDGLGSDEPVKNHLWKQQTVHLV